MYKADIKEPDSSLPPRCPRCNADGLQVGSTTLKAHLASEAAESLGEPAFWCATNDCPVAYFDLFERSVDCKASHGLYWPKDPAGPLCCCYGLTADEVDADIAEQVPSRVRAVVQKAGLPDAACTTKSPDGLSCVARVQRDEPVQSLTSTLVASGMICSASSFFPRGMECPLLWF